MIIIKHVKNLDKALELHEKYKNSEVCVKKFKDINKKLKMDYMVIIKSK